MLPQIIITAELCIMHIGHRTICAQSLKLIYIKAIGHIKYCSGIVRLVEYVI